MSWLRRVLDRKSSPDCRGLEVTSTKATAYSTRVNHVSLVEVSSPYIYPGAADEALVSALAKENKGCITFWTWNLLLKLNHNFQTKNSLQFGVYICKKLQRKRPFSNLGNAQFSLCESLNIRD
jgi:hypothetical protein